MSSKTCTYCNGSGYNAKSGVMPGSLEGEELCPECNGSGLVYTDEDENNSSKSGCFITTATLTSIGKSDDSYELNVFRDFRDNWLNRQNDGKQLIEEYYKIAPRIVSIIDSKENKKQIYENLWKQEIKPCMKLIEAGLFSDAKERYKNSIISLKSIYL